MESPGGRSEGLGPGLPISIDACIEILLGPNASELQERHLNALHRLCFTNKDGFVIRELPKVQSIIEITLGLLERAVGKEEFSDALAELLR